MSEKKSRRFSIIIIFIMLIVIVVLVLYIKSCVFDVRPGFDNGHEIIVDPLAHAYYDVSMNEASPNNIFEVLYLEDGEQEFLRNLVQNKGYLKFTYVDVEDANYGKLYRVCIGDSLYWISPFSPEKIALEESP